MDTKDRSVEINMSGIQIAGVGGLGMVIVALVMAMVITEARWLLVTGVAGGGALAVALVMIRRRITPRGPGPSDPHVLFRTEPSAGARESESPKRDLEHLVCAPAHTAPRGQISIF